MSSDDNFHALIKKAYEAGNLEIGVNCVRLNRPASPVYRWTDHNLPGFILAGFVIYNFYEGGLVWGLVSLGCSVVILLWLVRKWGFSRLDKRAKQYALSSSHNWWQLWNFGGLSLRLRDDRSIDCISPDDSWRGFARDHLLHSVGRAKTHEPTFPGHPFPVTSNGSKNGG